MPPPSLVSWKTKKIIWPKASVTIRKKKPRVRSASAPTASATAPATTIAAGKRLPDRQRRAFRRDQVHGIGGNAIEGAVAEADEAGRADQKMDAEREHRGDHGRGGKTDIVGRGEKRQRGEHRDADAKREPSAPRLRQHAMDVGHGRPPNRPVGR